MINDDCEHWLKYKIFLFFIFLEKQYLPEKGKGT